MAPPLLAHLLRYASQLGSALDGTRVRRAPRLLAAGLGLAGALLISACSSVDGGSPSGNGGEGHSGGQTASGGSLGPAGGAAAGGSASGGASSSTGGNASGGGPDAGTGGDVGSGGSDGSGGAAGFECTRSFLDGMLDDYFAALSAGDPSSLPLADGVKFTENAMQSEVGATEFWMNAGEAKHSQRLLDVDECSAAAQAVVPEGSTDLPIAVRLKIEAGELTEIETIVVRPGDYTASFAVESNTAAIIDIAEDIGWHDPVPEADRATREELVAWMDTYFRAFPNGVCDVTQQCRRLENGGGNFSCMSSCSGSSTTGFEPRVILADVERGIAAGLTIFDFMTEGHLDMHMMKMSGGQVHAVHAILRDTSGQSGWE